MSQYLYICSASLLLLLLSACGGGSGGDNSTVLKPEPIIGNLPTIELIGPNVVDHPLNTVYVDAGATGSDVEDGDLTGQVIISGEAQLNTAAVGDYFVRYSLNDSDGQLANEVVRIVRVNEGEYSTRTPRDLGATDSTSGYYEVLPQTYSEDPLETFPLIIYMHGSGEVGDDLGLLDGTVYPNRDLVNFFDSGILTGDEAAIALLPQTSSTTLRPILNSNDFSVSTSNLRAFIEYAGSTYNVDRSRIYITGFSLGAFQIWEYLLQHQDQVAAAVPIAGRFQNASTVDVCRFKDVPLWIFHANNDEAVPVSQSIQIHDNLNDCTPSGVTPRLTVFSGGGHVVDDDIFNLNGINMQTLAEYDPYDVNIYSWLLSQSREP